MRLVDANELKHEIVGAIPMMATVRISIEHKIDAAPTIDAIPVEWLEGLMLSTGDDVDKVEFAWIMRKWQEEQEVR